MTTLSQIISNKIVAIIRGVQLVDVPKIATALYDGGIRIVEVTLNSPGALQAIEQLNHTHGSKMLIGAGTELLKLPPSVKALGRRDDVARLLTMADIIASPSAFGEGLLSEKVRVWRTEW